MRAVADVMHSSTSTVSQQIAALSREVGAALLEPEGRRVRLTPAGRRLANHAVNILAAVDVAKADLNPGANPAGVVTIASYATAARRALIPLMRNLNSTYPAVTVRVQELEPDEAHEALLAGRVDLALAYDYNLAPAAPDESIAVLRLWESQWGLAVAAGTEPKGNNSAVGLFNFYAGAKWIGNSRNPAEEVVIRTLASLAQSDARIEHHADNLELVEDLVRSGSGVGLLPLDRYPSGVRVLPLEAPNVVMRTWAWTKKGAETWPPLALVLDTFTRGFIRR
ncbi:LysR family transcriptional regulator [Glutamicibacter sp. NPDC087344]|uniref:LysR family transcriptional regulator n=1 Tax=Glutamicibacter sp. NPDC087344 TaxID=3363994 RepID=UPI00382D483E